VRGVEELKQRLIDEFSGLGRSVIDDSTDEWCQRIRVFAPKHVILSMKLPCYFASDFAK